MAKKSNAVLGISIEKDGYRYACNFSDLRVDKGSLIFGKGVLYDPSGKAEEIPYISIAVDKLKGGLQLAFFAGQLSSLEGVVRIISDSIQNIMEGVLEVARGRNATKTTFERANASPGGNGARFRGKFF